MITSADIKARALEIGFDLCGIAPAEDFPELQRLREWIDRGYAGEMAYMPRTATRRGDVRRILPSARSVIVAAANYNVDRPYSTELADSSYAHIARYAWGDDYHDVLHHRLEALLEWMREQHREPFDARAYVDTGPVQERVYAQYAGIGWIGKNTCVINSAIGSWIFLSEIICSLPLDHDVPALDRCGTCALCLEACPTGAIVEPWVLDATRCLSYLTIELKGSMPESQRDAIGTHVFGCDVCQEVCPWNARPLCSADPSWQPRAALTAPRLIDLWNRSDGSLADVVHGTPMTRPQLRGLRRNLAVALGNSGTDEAAAALAENRSDASIQNPLVAEHVAWASGKLRDGRL
jgi:epoxyqueuosine reductase